MSENNFELTKSNITDQGGNFNPGPVTGGIFVPRGTQISDVATAMLEATYTTGKTLIMANRWLIVRFDKGERIFGSTPTQDEPKWEDAAFGGLRNKAAPGNKRLEFIFANLSPYTQKALASLEGQDLDFFELTENNYIRGKTDADKVVLEGYTVNQFVGAEVGGENSGVSNKFSLYIDYADANESTLLGIHALPTAFQFEDLDGIMDVEITEVSQSTSAIVVTVKTYVGNIPITGLVTNDFKVILQSTDGIVSQTATESSTVSGQYSLAGTFTTAAHWVKTTDQPDATNTEVETPDDFRADITVT